MASPLDSDGSLVNKKEATKENSGGVIKTNHEETSMVKNASTSGASVDDITSERPSRLSAAAAAGGGTAASHSLKK